jgi:hypothetical protein
MLPPLFVYPDQGAGGSVSGTTASQLFAEGLLAANSIFGYIGDVESAAEEAGKHLQRLAPVLGKNAPAAKYLRIGGGTVFLGTIASDLLLLAFHSPNMSAGKLITDGILGVAGIFSGEVGFALAASDFMLEHYPGGASGFFNDYAKTQSQLLSSPIYVFNLP